MPPAILRWRGFCSAPGSWRKPKKARVKRCYPIRISPALTCCSLKSTCAAATSRQWCPNWMLTFAWIPRVRTMPKPRPFAEKPSSCQRPTRAPGRWWPKLPPKIASRRQSGLPRMSKRCRRAAIVHPFRGRILLVDKVPLRFPLNAPVASFLAALFACLPLASAAPGRDKSVWNYDGGIIVLTDGSILRAVFRQPQARGHQGRHTFSARRRNG